MKKQGMQVLVKLMGHPTVATLFKKIMYSPYSRPFIRPYSSFYQINEHEMVGTAADYQSLGDFFTRSLHSSTRPIDSHPLTISSPTDGQLTATQSTSNAKTFQVKGHHFSIEELFGDMKKARPYLNGQYAVLYLSPRDYHHFHYPFSGTVISRYSLGTTSYPVNELGLQYGNQPLATNHRMITEVQTKYGKYAIIKVGALNVNSICITSPQREVTKGQDFGYFSFGSTVLLFFEETAAVTFTALPDHPIRVGQALATWNIGH